MLLPFLGLIMITKAEQVRVLVTGGSGLVGSAIQAEVAHENKSDETWLFSSILDVDLTKYESTKGLFDRFAPTHVIHLAAAVGGVFKNQSSNADMLNINLRMNDNTLRAAHEMPVAPKVVSCMSTCIFPDKTTYPINEGMLHNGPPHDSNFGYAYAKRYLDIANRAYHVQYGHLFTSVIPTNIYGPHDNFNLADSHVIPGLIHRCWIAKKSGQPLRVSGTGSPLRQFIYSRDLAKLVLWTLRNYNDVEPIILSVDESAEVTIREVVDAIVKAFDFRGEVIYSGNPHQDGQHKKTADNSKLRRLLGEKGFEFTPLEEGIEQTVRWFLDNVDKGTVRL